MGEIFAFLGKAVEGAPLAAFAAAGTSADAVQRYLSWNERSGGPELLRKVCGGLLLLGGLYMIYLAP